MAELSPVLFEALQKEAASLKVIDDDILRCHPDITNALTVEDAANPEKIREAVKAIKRKSPSLFRESDYSEMNHREWAEAEKAFRDTLKTSRPIAGNPYKALDASRLNAEEMHHLKMALSGYTNCFDAGLLRRALARQLTEDSALPRDAA